MNFEILATFVIICGFLYEIYDKIKKTRQDANVVLKKSNDIEKKIDGVKFQLQTLHNNQKKIQNTFNEIQLKLNKMRYRRKVLIIGCGRSGTGYASRVFNELGVHIGHETDGEDGIASWLMVTNDANPPFGPSRNEYEFGCIIHQVRNPVDTIASVQTFAEISWKYIAKYIPIEDNDSLLIKCAKYWYYWNLEAEKRSSLTYRVEDFQKVAPKIIEMIGVGKFDINKIREQSKKVNTRKHCDISLLNIREEDEDLFNNIIQLAIRYGYDKKKLK